MGKRIRSVFVRSGLPKDCAPVLVCPYCHQLFGAYGEMRKKPRSPEKASVKVARNFQADGRAG